MGERIHQNIVVSSERDTFLYRRQIGRVTESIPFQDGLGIHFGTGGNDACGVELYLIKYPVYIQLFHPHTGEGGIVVACRLPGCQLSSQKMVYRLIHITCFCSSLCVPEVPRYGCGLCRGCVRSFSRCPVRHRSCRPSGGRGRPRRTRVLSGTGGRVQSQCIVFAIAGIGYLQFTEYWCVECTRST